jgi:hypothetical protein
VATVGTLQVNIVATTDKFLSGLNSASDRLTSFVKSVSTIQNVIGGVIGGAMAMVVKSAVDAGGHIYELTKKLHISAEGITALHYAADQLESSSEAVDNALAKMAVVLGNANTKGGEAAAAFTNLGLNFRDLAAQPVQQQFLSIVDALNSIPDTARRAAYAQAIFGKGSKELSAILDAGTTAIIEQGKAAADMGAIMSGETAKGLDDVGDAWKNMTDSLAAFRNEAVSIFGPFISGISWLGTKAIEYIKALGYWFQERVIAPLDMATKATIALANAFNYLLPKSMEFDTQSLQSYADTFAAARKDRLDHANDFANRVAYGGGNTPNPLQPATPTTTEVAKNTATTNDKLTELIAATKARRDAEAQPPQEQSPPVQIAIAGVR